MRKIIWIGGPKPEKLSDEAYKKSVLQLAEFVGGEAIGFGTDNYAIVGDEEGEKRMNMLNKEKKEASKTINTPA